MTTARIDDAPPRRRDMAGLVEYAARRVYDAETVLHAARQSHVDAWISAAYDRLHIALEDYQLARRTA